MIRSAVIALAMLLATSSAFAGKRCNYCQRDAHGKISRSPAAKYDFKQSNPCPATGVTSGACPGYVIDHVVPLKRGGADNPNNMQWQTKEDAREKDRWE